MLYSISDEQRATEKGNTMPKTMLVVSDLHLADGDAVLDGWGRRQQEAFVALLNAAQPGGKLADETVELVINGDCFDFLLAQPSLEARLTTDVTMAHAKWAAIATAHEPFFAALHDFLRSPTHRVTFTIGNHDLELLFPSIRARVRFAINAAPGMVRFCLTRAYQPVADVIIEHGCQYDPWNIIPAVWDAKPPISTPMQLETGDGRGSPVGPMTLPWGSRYFYHAFLPTKQRFPYIDMLMPPLDSLRQGALLSLLAPDLLAEAMRHSQDLVANPGEPFPTLSDADDVAPTQLFSMALGSMQQVMSEVLSASGGWNPQAAQALGLESARLYAALELERSTALATIVAPQPIEYADGKTLPPTSALLHDAPTTRYAIVGHTHLEGRWTLSTDQVLLDTGTWLPRLAAPEVAAWDSAFAEWFAHPLMTPYAGDDATRFTVAWVRSEQGIRSVVELIAWDGDGFIPVSDRALAAWLPVTPTTEPSATQ